MFRVGRMLAKTRAGLENRQAPTQYRLFILTNGSQTYPLVWESARKIVQSRRSYARMLKAMMQAASTVNSGPSLCIWERVRAPT